MKSAAIFTKLKPFWVAIISVIVAAGSYVYASTRASVIVELEDQQDTLSRQITLIDTNTRNATNLADQVSRLEADLKMVNERLFEPEARAINTNFFYQLVGESNVRIVQARQAGVQAGGADATFSRIDFALVVEGTFEELVDFLYRLQTLDRFIRPVNLALQAGAPGGRGQAAGRQMSMSINVRVLAEK